MTARFAADTATAPSFFGCNIVSRNKRIRQFSSLNQRAYHVRNPIGCFGGSSQYGYAFNRASALPNPNPLRAQGDIVTLHAGFPEAACARALASTNGDASRALDWLLANPLDAANAAAGHPARPVIHSMGFEETMVQLALAQADGNEEIAINLLLNGEVRPTATAPASSAAVSDGRAIFSMGFDDALVRRALRRANDREDVAVEILLTGSVAARDEVVPFGTAPSSWHGTREEHDAAMELSMEAYMLQVIPAFSSRTPSLAWAF